MPSVVVTHDFMETYGGAERVTQEIAAAFPDAPVVALLGRREVARRMRVEDRFHSVLPPRPRLLRHYRLLAPAWGMIADRARLPAADVVVSSSYAYAHRMIPAGAVANVCYCHSPLRFAWSMTEGYRDRWTSTGVAASAFDAMAAGARRADRAAAQRVHTYLTQSPFTAEQIERFYGRRADVIGAPIDCDTFRPAAVAPEDYFVLVGRLVEPYKRVGIAIEAFRRLGRRLLIAGDGPAMRELKEMAPPNVEFLGLLEDEPLAELMGRSLAAIFPSRDDFGLVPVEVMACGRPVLAYNDGGARYTVRAGVTGEFFDAQLPESIVAAVEAFDPSAYDPMAIREHALQWDRSAFRRHIVEAVQRAVRGSESSA